jgi:hypothetical protein
MDAAQVKSYQDIKAKLHARESAAKRIKRSSLLGMISNVAGYLLFSCGPSVRELLALGTAMYVTVQIVS